MKIKCPKCHKTLNIPDKLLGKTVKCPCGQPLKTRASTPAKPIPKQARTSQENDFFGGLDLSSTQSFPASAPAYLAQASRQASQQIPHGNSSLLQAAEREHQANQHERTRGNQKAIVMFVLAVLSVPVVGVGSALLAYVSRTSFPPKASSSPNAAAEKSEENKPAKGNPKVDQFEWNGIRIGSTIEEVRAAKGYAEKIRSYPEKFKEDMRDAESVLNGKTTIDFHIWDDPVDNICVANFRVDNSTGLVDEISLGGRSGFAKNYWAEDFLAWITEQVGEEGKTKVDWGGTVTRDRASGEILSTNLSRDTKVSWLGQKDYMWYVSDENGTWLHIAGGFAWRYRDEFE